MIMIISPSILSCDFLNIERELNDLSTIDNLWLHLDIMDGHFVPNLTFGHPLVELISKATKIKLDAHLMVTNPQFYLDTFKNYPIHNITFHFESSTDIETLINNAKKHYPHVGLSLRPKTKIKDVPLALYKMLDLVLIMSVEPGFSGQKFISETYQKIEDLNQIKKDFGLSFMIQVDGGVDSSNAKKLELAGAQNLVAGSYIFKKDGRNYQQKIMSLRE